MVDTRVSDEGDIVRRRRKCTACEKRFTTYERPEIQLPQVVKKNGSRIEFSRAKLRASLDLALRKRPVSTELVDAAVKYRIRDGLKVDLLVGTGVGRDAIELRVVTGIKWEF